MTSSQAKVKLLAMMFVTIGVTIAVLAPAQAVAQERATRTPIEHLVFLMQENHSFDNYFGTYPGANGLPADTCIPVDPFAEPDGPCVKPFHIGDTDVQMDDPDHSENTHSVQYHDGRLDGFVYALNQRSQDGRLAMGYYDESDLPYYWNIAENYVLFDNFFSSAAGGSNTNHFFWVSATPGQAAAGETQQETLAETPTIFDRLQEHGISWKFYVQNYEPGLTYRTLEQYPGNRAAQVIWVPLLNFDRFLDDPELSQHIVNLDEYYEDLANGTLPAVAFIAPSGPSEHPPSSLQSGQRFVKTLIQRLMQSQYWNNTAFLWAYDDWGGWYDHVPPPQVDDYGFGFRVPALLVSAYARHSYIDSTLLDYTSVLKFIEDNWGVPPLTERDANANSIINAFDFSQPPRQPVILPYERAGDAIRPAPRRTVIVAFYGGALLLASVVFLLPMRRKSKDPNQAAGTGNEK